MTKTLTEQWREGELFGLHYVKIPKEEVCIHNVSCMDYLLDEYGVEVLERVPSYEEYRELLDLNVYEKDRKKVMGLEDKVKRLQKQINEANTVICDLYNLVIDKRVASGVVCDYLVKYGKPFDVKSGV